MYRTSGYTVLLLSEKSEGEVTNYCNVAELEPTGAEFSDRQVLNFLDISN